MSSGPPLAAWLELLVALGVGAAAVVALAAATSRRLRRGTARRSAWQAAVLALSVAAAAEVSGIGALAAQQAFRIWRGGGSLPDGMVDVGHPGASPPVEAAIEPLPGPSPWSSDAGGDLAAELTACSGAVPPFEQSGPQAELQDLDAPLLPALCAAAAAGSWWPGVLWLAVGSLLLGRRAFASALLALLRRRHAPCADRGLEASVKRLARELGIARRVELRLAPGLSGPISFGVLRPTIALPAPLLHERDAWRRDAILAHELAHIAGRDRLWHLLADLAAATLWWHPLVWLARRELQTASELAADEASLLVDGGPELLAGCLVELCAAGGRRTAGLAAEGRWRSGVGRRVERLLEIEGERWKPVRPFRSLAARGTGAALMVGAAMMSAAGAGPRPLDDEEGGSDMLQIVQDHWRRSIAGAALIAALGAEPGTAAQDAFEEAVRVQEEAVRAEKKAAEAAVRAALETELKALRERIAVLEAKLGEVADRSARGPGQPPGPRTPQRPPSRSAAGEDFLAEPGVAQNLGLPAPAGVPGASGASSPAAGRFDVVALAMALPDAEAQWEITRLQVERLGKLSATGQTTQEEVSIAEIRLRAAERKLALLRSMARLAASATQAELQQLEGALEVKRRLHDVGRASGLEVEALAAQVAGAEAMLEALRLLAPPEPARGRGTRR
jgi:hypothetical protein